MAPLVRYHARHKLLFMAHNQAGMRELGRVIANAENLTPSDVVNRYRQGLGRVLARPAQPGAVINAAQHALGYVSDGLSAGEKQHFDHLLNDYRQRRKPLSAVTAVLSSWVERFQVAYLAEQYLFSPYPAELMTVHA